MRKQSITQKFLFPILGITCLTAVNTVTAQEQQASLKLEEVVVTARKHEENLQETPISITAVSADMIEDAQLQDISSLESITPNLNIASGNDGGSSSIQAFIRGVGETGTTISSDPAVGIYIDGIYVARTVGADMKFKDIERVSVLRGPQGTLFGKNTIGGAINVVTRKPSGEDTLNIELTAGNYGHKSISAYGETSLVDNVLAASLSFYDTESDGYHKRPGENLAAEDGWGARAHLSWTPSDTFNSHLILGVVKHDQQPKPRVLETFDGSQLFPFLYNTFVAGADLCCEPNRDIDRTPINNDDSTTPTFEKLDSENVSWINEWQIGDLTLKSITGYRAVDSATFRDTDNDIRNYFGSHLETDQNQFSQEFLFSSTALDDKLEWVAGLYYFKEDASYYAESNLAIGLYEALSALPLSVTFGPGGPPFAFLAVPFDISLRRTLDQEVTSYAAFVHTSYALSDTTNLTLAGRFTKDEKDFSSYSFKESSQTRYLEPGPTLDGNCSDVTARGIGASYSCSKSWSEFSPTIGLDHQFSEDLMAYARISRGFRSGVYAQQPLSSPEISTADPETLTSYELGFKAQFMDQRVQLNGAVFYNDYENQQFLVNQPTEAGLALTISNAGESTATGAELELTALLTESLTLTGGLSYIDPEFDEYTAVEDDGMGGQIEVDLSDRPFQYTPDWNASLGLQYEKVLGNGGHTKIRGDVAYQSDIHYTSNPDDLAFDLLNEDGHTIVDGNISYTTPNNQWQFSLYGKNLLDKRVINGAYSIQSPFGIVDTSYNEPRRVFFAVKYMM